ncbi:MarR family winged helix-turn-helix transcriptional regulator [Planosporangium sp. 12N6]|uniref:MarR family winged helix-turn-helix transcriptional regulator n=1 Tax=Planosporangium spinosum TaxID=3402278 RepID=UPI003CE80130
MAGTPQRRPLGYWIKQIDRAVEANLDRLLSIEDLGRRSWQVLNTIAQAPVTLADLDAAVAPFLSDDEPTTRPYVDALAARGWVEIRAGESFTLTGEGERAYRRVASRVHAARARIVEGLSAQEYETLVDLLERVAANLKVTPATA